MARRSAAFAADPCVSPTSPPWKWGEETGSRLDEQSGRRLGPLGRCSMTSLIVGLIVAVVLGGLGYWTLRRRSPESGPWMSGEEAARKAAEWQKVHGVTSGPEHVLSPQEKAELLEWGAKKTQADIAAGIVRLTISMPAPIQPVERGERFEEPLIDALGDLGEVDGGGSLLAEVDGKMVIQQADIEVYVKDVPKGLAVIRKCLKAQGAPKGTTITQYAPREVEYALDD
jgi:hypothetical protein